MTRQLINFLFILHITDLLKNATIPEVETCLSRDLVLIVKLISSFLLGFALYLKFLLAFLIWASQPSSWAAIQKFDCDKNKTFCGQGGSAYLTRIYILI